MSGAQITVPDKDTAAIDASGASIHGSVLLNATDQKNLAGRFTSNGVIKMTAVRIDGLLNLIGAQFTGGFSNGLDISYARIDGPLLWRNVGLGPATDLKLSGASIRALVDEQKSWPGHAHLYLDGCVYGRFGLNNRDKDDDNSENEECWKAWLSLQPQFRPQPYEMLAKVLADRGLEDDALQVHIDEEDARLVNLHWGEWIWRNMLRYSVAYGYRPLLAFRFIGVFCWYRLYFVFPRIPGGPGGAD